MPTSGATCWKALPARAAARRLLAAAAALLLPSAAAAQEADGGYPYASQEQLCQQEFRQLRSALDASRLQMTVVASDAAGHSPYVMLRARIRGMSYVSWEHLNGEIRGYALRDLSGYDYSRDRNYAGALTVHPTRIWDRLFDSGTGLHGYSCVIAGRTRLMGRRVSLIKLTPRDGLRFVYVVAKDDENALPVELAVVDPVQAKLISKFTVVRTEFIASSASFEVNDALHDRYALPPPAAAPAAGPGEFRIPEAFTLVDSGSIDDPEQAGAGCTYQMYSDGILTFQVFKARGGSNYFPVASHGPVLVLKKQARLHEYTVVGEIPAALAEYVLSRL